MSIPQPQASAAASTGTPCRVELSPTGQPLFSYMGVGDRGIGQSRAVQRAVRRQATRAAAPLTADRPRAGARLKSLNSWGQRVVITGIGALTPVGKSAAETWGNLVEGQSGIGEISIFDTTGFDVRIAGEVKDFHPENYIDKKH